MGKYVLVVFFVILFCKLDAQVYHREIDWAEQEDSEQMFSSSYSWATFAEDGLPIYTASIALSGSNQQIRITNLEFGDLDRGLLNHIPSVSEELDLKISYSNSGENPTAWIEFIPIISSDSGVHKLMSFDIEILSFKNGIAKSQKEWRLSSVLSSGNWVKLQTTQRGIHKITYSQLADWGFPVPTQVNLYGNGGYMLPKMNDDYYADDLVQNRIWHGKDKNDDDCIFFYSTGTVEWTFDNDSGLFKHELNDYSDFAYYYISDQGESSLIEVLDEELSPYTHNTSSYSDYLFYEDESENLLMSGRKWFGEEFPNGKSEDYSFSVPNIDESSPIDVYIEAAGRSESTSRFEISVDGIETAEIVFQSVDVASAIALFASTNSSSFSIDDPNANFELELKYLASNSSSSGWLDYIEMNLRRNIVVDNSELIFRDERSVGPDNVTQFNLTVTSDDLQLWDVTNYTNPQSISYSIAENLAQFKVRTDSLREFVAFYPTGDFPEPEKVEDIANQNLHQANVPEMIIISHPDFLLSANSLANFHQEYDQMDVSVVPITLIYNEFSGGLPDVSGVRNYLRMCYDRTNAGDGDLKYVLLFGDGSYDNKNVLGLGLNFIPTYQSENSLLPTSSFVTDDFFVLLDDGEGEYQGLIDLGIGRIPAKNSNEAEIVVQKIKNYTSSTSLGNWRNVISFIGDDEDANTHMSQAEALADDVNSTNPAFFTDKIYFDAYQEQSTPGGDKYPDVNTAISNRVKNGALILNYTGHANETALAAEKILETNDIDNWTNYNKLPIFITATCEFSRFDADDNSGGEHILFNPNGGGIGLFSTTRVVYSIPNFILNEEFYRHIFSQDENGENLRMGDVLKRTKNGISTGINKRNFTLLADPALSLSFPKYQVVTETINGNVVGEQTDTLKALSTVVVTGKITDHMGNTLTDFDGEIIPIVYDKQDTVKTLGNGGETPFLYKIQSNIIYKGITTVSSGEFEFSFIVPKDISYAVAPGKIVYYANNGVDDANGYTTDFLIGDFSENTINDVTGPTVDIYLNNEDFQSGDEVGKNPILYAVIKDDTGINTVGTGIGHDITAVIDDDYSNIIVLNDYYLSDLDSYTSGSIIFPLNDIEVGEHTVKIKVWDVLNNSSEKEITFRITNRLEIKDVMCYPNPVSEYTNIQFTHNRPDESFDARVEIFDFSGSLIDVITERLISNGNESIPLLWEVSKSQVLVRSGAYLYRIIIDADDGSTANKTGRMIISRY